LKQEINEEEHKRKALLPIKLKGILFNGKTEEDEKFNL